jgi:hypothetical protein
LRHLVFEISTTCGHRFFACLELQILSISVAMKTAFFYLLLLVHFSVLALSQEEVNKDQNETVIQNSATANVSQTSSDKKRPVLFGHLLSQTTETMVENQCTVGFVEVGCGTNFGLNIVTSPFLYFSYNTNNVILRWSPTSGIDNDYAFQYAYFKTFDEKNRTYSMEAHSFWAMKRLHLAENYNLYLGLNHMQFIDDTAPFSLRREPFNGQMGQSTVFTLNELLITEKVSFFVEFAVLGLNFVYPNFHFGASMAYRSSEHVLWQFGLSATGLMAYAANATYNTQYQSYKDQKAYFSFDDSYMMAVSIHPEMNWQYFF